jgi:hypothetical protein
LVLPLPLLVTDFDLFNIVFLKLKFPLSTWKTNVVSL